MFKEGIVQFCVSFVSFVRLLSMAGSKKRFEMFALRNIDVSLAGIETHP